jgi:2-polyprenyl-6-methoxyphenol hydroxylase-like FAD-dependent oxidoreductase
MTHSSAAQDEPDELDALLQHYEQQAAADVAAVQHQAAGARKKRKLTADEKREEALSQPLGAENK